MIAAAALPQGWMGKKCRRWLRRAAARLRRRAVIVEVGSWRGRSTLVLAAAMPPRARLYAVDTWAGTPDDAEQHERLYAGAGDVYADFCTNLSSEIRRGRVTPLRMTSIAGAAELTRALGPRSVDLVFIDADHRYDAVRGDILAYLPLVKPGGIISGHDFNPETWPGVVKAVTELVPRFRVYKDSTIWSATV